MLKWKQDKYRPDEGLSCNSYEIFLYLHHQSFSLLCVKDFTLKSETVNKRQKFVKFSQVHRKRWLCDIVEVRETLEQPNNILGTGKKGKNSFSQLHIKGLGFEQRN